METFIKIRRILGENALILIFYIGNLLIWRTWLDPRIADKLEVVLLVPKLIGEKLDGSAPPDNLTGFSDPLLGIFVFMAVNVLLFTAVSSLIGSVAYLTLFRSK